MYYDFEVKYTDLDGKIYPVLNGKTTYIALEYGRGYSKEKKYSLVKRTVIGKPIPNKEGFMYPNSNFMKLFPDNIPQDINYLKRCKALTIGEHILIHKVVDNLKLDEYLIKAGFNEDTTNFILDFASYQLIEQSNVAQYFDKYEAKYPLFAKDMKIISDSTVSRKLDYDITEDNIINFFDVWNTDRDKDKRIWCSYDSTNMNCQAGDIEFADFGWAKDDPSKPVIEYSIVYDTTNHIPLLYEFYPGDISDTSQLQIVIEKVNTYGYKNIGFILDRGYFSKSNLDAMEELKIAYIIMMKAHKDVLRDLIDKKRGTFELKYDSKIKINEPIYGTKTKSKLSKIDEEDRNIYLYFNEARKYAETSNFIAAIEQMEEYLMHCIAHPEYKNRYKFGPLYDKFFDLKFDKDAPKYLIGYKVKSDIIDKEVSYLGYFCIIYYDPSKAETLPSPADIYKLYKSRDVSEKVFAGKSYLGDNALRTYNLSRASAKKFIAFIAAIIRNEIHYNLFDSMKCLGKKRNYMDVPAALKELSMIILNESQTGNYTLDHAINKKEKDIFEAFGMKEEDIIKSIGNITGRLSKQFIHGTRTKSKE